MSRKKKNHPEKTWPTQSLRAELAAITVAKRACDWATEVTWTVSYTAWSRSLHTADVREIWIDQSGFSRQDNVPDVNAG